MAISDMGGTPTFKNRIDSYWLSGLAGTGSTNANIPYFTNIQDSQFNGVLKMENSSVFGFSVTALVACVVNMSVSYSSRSGISLNSTQLSTALTSISPLSGIVAINNETNADIMDAKVNIILQPGEVLRPHNSASTPATPANCKVTVFAMEILT